MRGLATFLVCLSALATSALAEARVTLVIGNRNYSSVASLDNALSDSQLIAQALDSLASR